MQIYGSIRLIADKSCLMKYQSISTNLRSIKNVPLFGGN